MYSALLFPYRHCVTKVKKKRVPSVSLVVKDSLKRSNNSSTFVTNVLTNVDEYRSRVWSDEFSPRSIGQLL